MVAGAGFFKMVWAAPINKKALENPIPHKYALKEIGKNYSQIVQPWYFGDPESKATCLWLYGLPPLMPTVYAEPERYKCKCGNIFGAEAGKYGCCESAARPLWNNQTASGQNKLPPSKDRAKIRSKTYQGFADAMALQWG